MKMLIIFCTGYLALSGLAAEWHVAAGGDDRNAGTRDAPLRTIQRAADLAQPGDLVTVHEGVYRERVNPLRGGESETRRITYQAAPSEKVVIAGSEPVGGWTRVTNDTWTATVPNSLFGAFNPFSDLIRGDWFNPKGRQHHTGAVYLNGEWLAEAAKKEEAFAPVGAASGASGDYLVNVAWLRLGSSGVRWAADAFAEKRGMNTAACSEGGRCLGWIRDGDWARYEGLDLGGAGEVEIRAASVTGGGLVEVRLDRPDGLLLGTCTVDNTGDWQRWRSFTAPIKPAGGKRALCLVFRSRRESSPLWFAEAGKERTTIWAQFPGADPNSQKVEINVRQTVFTPSKAGVNYLTLRGFELRNAATPWAPPTAAQIGAVSAYWCKGWIIESNTISHSTCCGIALGKYGDAYDNTSADTAEGYVGTLTRALSNGWNRATVGGHLVRGNTISHCEQTGIVGSLGCSFSTISDNVIHDIHVRQLFGGAEMAGVKLHGAIDVVIRRNHIFRCGDAAGIWLDWMAQGARVTGNLLHDNFGGCGDLFLEMQHGPMLVDNNLFLSKRLSVALNAQGIAFAHNLIAGPINNMRRDKRSTPYQTAHSTALAGMFAAADGDSGDHRFYNNLFAHPSGLGALDGSALPCFAAGNVFVAGAKPSRFDACAASRPDFDPVVRLVERADGWYLALAEDGAWRQAAKPRLATTAVLGRAKVSACAYENGDGSELSVGADYFGNPRDVANPMPGPFENPAAGSTEIKVW